MTLPASSFHFSPAAAPFPLLTPCFVSCLSLCPLRDRRSVTRSARPRADALGNRRLLGPLRPPTLPTSRRFQVGTATPFAPRLDRTASSSPKGEAVIMKDALRAIPLSGAFCGLSQYLMQQRRAVRGTVREERDGAAGDEEPATKSRASSIPTMQE